GIRQEAADAESDDADFTRQVAAAVLHQESPDRTERVEISERLQLARRDQTLAAVLRVAVDQHADVALVAHDQRAEQVAAAIYNVLVAVRQRAQTEYHRDQEPEAERPAEA